MKMMDWSEAFPRKVNMDQYLPLIESALKAATGKDSRPRVVFEDYPDKKSATRAANAMRNHVRHKKLELVVAQPNESTRVFVYKGTPDVRPRKKNAQQPLSSEAPEASAGDGAAGGDSGETEPTA
jgi:hypothetical protein